MAKITSTLHPKNNIADELYPNIINENIPNGEITPNKLSFHAYSHHIFMRFSQASYGEVYAFLTLVTNKSSMTLLDVQEYLSSALIQEANGIACGGKVSVSGSGETFITALRYDIDNDYLIFDNIYDELTFEPSDIVYFHDAPITIF